MLSEEQKAEVAKWFAAGASLDEIQKRLKADFNVHMTYLDLRLLVADLPQPVEAEPAPAAEPPAAPVADDADDLPAPADAVPDAPGAEKPAGDVSVEMDALTIPGTLASGDVVFSDGTKAKWYLDQQGRLGLGQAPAGYRPSPTDAALFQTRLMELLRNRGMM